MHLSSSTPHVFEFDPRHISYQAQVIDDIYYGFDYSLGTHEVLLSGAVGSAKSLLLAHLVVRHCLEDAGACVLLGRKALTDIKETIFKTIIDHLDCTDLKVGRDYRINTSSACITFRNGSRIISRSWIDKNYKKMRSLALSMAVIEELTENNEQDKEAFLEILMRVGRLPHLKRPILICATNPDSPSHWAYDYFIRTDVPTRHVYYSVTTDNPFLPPQYTEQLRKNLPPKLALRMIHGRWIEIQGEVIYCEYDGDIQMVDRSYVVNAAYPVCLTWDFNIAEGKPLSMACFQYIDDHFHIFNEVVIHGARTLESVDELKNKGLLRKDWHYHIMGDAAGKHRDTRGANSDWDLIQKELKRQELNFAFCVPSSNPGLRTRHNTVNGYCRNDLGDRRLTVYKDAPTADKGLRLTKLKKGADYIEDDTKDYQHITTAIGYGIMYLVNIKTRKPQGTVQL